MQVALKSPFNLKAIFSYFLVFFRLSPKKKQAEKNKQKKTSRKKQAEKNKQKKTSRKKQAKKNKQKKHVGVLCLPSEFALLTIMFYVALLAIIFYNQNKARGGEQSLVSQGIIHKGMKYLLGKFIPDIAGNLLPIAKLWDANLSGKGELVLSDTSFVLVIQNSN